MKNYKEASENGQDIIFKYFKERMKKKNIKQDDLAEVLNISVSSIVRYFKKQTPMPFGVYLEICAALELRPYLIPSEIDENEMQRIFFN